MARRSVTEGGRRFVGRSSTAASHASKLLLAFCAILPALVPGRALADGNGQFVIRCEYSHTLPDDPIVFPGQPGASHLHDFFGNKSVNANSTQDSMLAGETTCDVPSDTAGYWAPVGYMDGEQIKPRVMRIYYLAPRGELVETIPPGLQMIGGSKDATAAAENPHVSWSCGETNQIRTPLMDHPYNCKPYSIYSFVDGVVGIVDMPTCWDGAGLTPSSMAYKVDGVCPPGFSHNLPKLSQRIHYGVMNPLNPDGTVALTLSSGAYYSLHSDFWNTWQQARLDKLVADCLVARKVCGSISAAPEIEWTSQFGTERVDAGHAIAVDRSGIYVAGLTDHKLDGKRHFLLSDAFVRKHRPNGSRIWTRQFGTSGFDEARAIAVDPTGIYVAGFTDGRLPEQTSRGSRDAFVRKYDARGAELWTRQFGTSGSDEALAIAVDHRGIYIAGSTDGKFATEVASGGLDAFLRRYKLNGTELWTRQFGTPGIDVARGVAVASNGLFVAGTTGGILFEQVSQGGQDAFVRKYSLGGSEAWTRQLGTAGSDGAAGVTVRKSSVYVVGSTDGALAGQSSAGGVDSFISRHTLSGIEQWTREFGTASLDEPRAVTALSKGIYVIGTTEGAISAQPRAGEADAYVRQYNPKGEEIWTRQFGTSGPDEGLALAVDATGVYGAGLTGGTFEGETFAGEQDVFLIKLGFV